MFSNQTIKYRAKTFSDIIGQPQVINVLKNRAVKKDWSTATLLYGPTGTGKTTTAYLMAMSINCTNLSPEGNPCLSCPSCRTILNETFVRDTRRLRGDATGGKGEIQDFFFEVDSKPLYDRKKIYIIEESDQLSTSAKNSLHTILESPKNHVHFILISMVNSGIPKSIKDRCQTYNFNRLSLVSLLNILKSILEKNGLWESPAVPKEFKLEGLKLIASCSMGSAREAIQHLEKCITGGFFTVDEIKENIEKVSEDKHTEEVMFAMLHGKKEEFYNSIAHKFDVMSFIRFGYHTIARTVIFRYTKEVDLEFKKPIYQGLLSSDNFDLLAEFFRNVSKEAVNYMRLGDFIMLAEEYFSKWQLPMRKPRNGKL